MIFDELSNAVFCSRLRLIGAELEGGGVQTPPPVGGGKSRGPGGRGLMGAELDGGGRSNAPPPSRRWKIKRPSGARVKFSCVRNL